MKVLFVPFKNLLPQSYGSSVIKFHWPAKLDTDILEWQVKWALGSITMNKAIGDEGFLGKLFQILKDDVVKVLHSTWQLIWKTQQWKRSVVSPIPKKSGAK